jgi:hypothetical protein
MIYHCYGLTITAGSRAFSIAGFEIGNGSIELSLLFFEPVVLAKKKNTWQLLSDAVAVPPGGRMVVDRVR